MAALSAARRAANFALVQSKIMTQFVPQSFLSLMCDGLLAAIGGPLNRTLKQPDAIGHSRRIRPAALGKRYALIQSQKRMAACDTTVLQMPRSGFVFHHNREVLEALPESARDACESVFHDLFEVRAVHESGAY